MGDVVQFRDWQNPKDLARMYGETTLEQQAVKIMTVALIGPGGIDDLIYESSIGFCPNRDMLADTTPCEYVAPDDDCA